MDYLQVRCLRLSHLWLGEDGRPLATAAIYILLKRLGERAGIPNLHTHRFRHTFAIGYLRSGGAERYLPIIGGWRRIPETYFRTLGIEDIARVHRELSPADRLAKQSQRQRGHPFKRPQHSTSYFLSTDLWPHP